jgi:SMI1 / KNR4 family (SUKH-1)
MRTKQEGSKMWPLRRRRVASLRFVRGELDLKPFERLQAYWLDTGANVQTTTLNEATVAELEHKYDVRLPADFREYLLQSCPSNENWDQGGAFWWPLARIKNIPEEYAYEIKNDRVARDASKYLFFADYMIWCWAWAIACGDSVDRGRIVVVGASDDFVADSFGHFVDRYTKNELSVT